MTINEFRDKLLKLRELSELLSTPSNMYTNTYINEVKSILDELDEEMVKISQFTAKSNTNNGNSNIGHA